MSDFVKQVDSDTGKLIFTFSRINAVKKVIYFTSVSGGERVHFFNMEKRNGSWKMIEAPKLPDWILKYEAQLSQAIEENDK